MTTMPPTTREFVPFCSFATLRLISFLALAKVFPKKKTENYAPAWWKSFGCLGKYNIFTLSFT